MRVSVIVPTYRRPADLERCLLALFEQRRRADQIVVVCRDNDHETSNFFASFWPDVRPPEVIILRVCEPGQVAALNAALQVVDGDIVAITDDDAAPRPQWLERIENHFSSDPTVGAVGGRDYVHPNPDESESDRVGILQWFGRTVGNHHVGLRAVSVDFLKGANMSYRASAIRGMKFDERLRGAGAQLHNDLAFSLNVRKRGWALFYDPEVAVDHYPSVRFDEHQRGARNKVIVEERAFNETLTLLEHIPKSRHPFFWIWAILVGTRQLPGIAQCIRLIAARPPAFVYFWPMVRGRITASRVGGF